MVAVAIGGAAVVGAGATLAAGSKAAKAQKSAASQSNAEIQREYDQTRADQAPYREVGYGALNKLAGMYGVTPTNASGAAASGAAGYVGDGGFTTSPGYQFRLDQGVQAAQRSAAARGVLQSGGTMKAIQRYGEGLASSEYDAYANRLAQLAGVGQSATNATQAAGQTASQSIAQNLTNSGNASASSYANTGAAISNGAQNLASLYLYQKGGGFGVPTASSYGAVRGLPSTISGPATTLPAIDLPGY